MSLHVIDAGLATLVVDFGRPGYRSLGVAVGGAADRTSLALGNALVGNPIDAAALEITLSGPTLRAECDVACVLFGAPFELATNHPIAAGRTFTLKEGQELSVHGVHQGMRAYLCVGGGIQAPQILGSASGLETVKAGVRLPCASGVIRPRRLPSFAAGSVIGKEFEGLFYHLQFERPQPRRVRVLPGSQADWFNSAEFFGQDFKVSSSSNRMGLRLQGRALTLPQRELVSEPVSPGAVQVTRDGQCIILGIDGQTIGGYPKIAHVISADLDLVGQLRPGELIRFDRVGLPEAENAFATKQQGLRSWVMRLLA